MLLGNRKLWKIMEGGMKKCCWVAFAVVCGVADEKLPMVTMHSDSVPWPWG